MSARAAGRPLFSDSFDDFCRHSGDDRPRWDILCDNRSSADNRTIANGYAGADCHPCAQPYLVADDDWLCEHPAALVGIGIVVERRNDRLRAYQHIVADGDAALILELATGVDEHALADLRVLATIRMERREHREGLVDFARSQL